MTINGLALCAGVGGLEAGIGLAVRDYRTVCYVEREAYAAATLVARMEDATLDRAPIWDDVATFNGRAWRDSVDLISAGFPCQPWSSAGKRKGTADERWLWPDILRVLTEVRPGFAFFENSPRLDVHGVQATLREVGYGSIAGKLRAKDIGAPHRRDRVYLLAYGDGDRCEGERSRGLLDRIRTALWNDVDGCGLPTMDDVDSAGLQIEQGRGSWPCRSDPSFPPCRVHIGSWWKGPQPAVSGGVDGPARRVDRLRVGGNGVVPLAVAYAFTALCFAAEPT